MEQQDVRTQPVGLEPATALKIGDEARWLREREQARETWLLQVLRQQRREQEQRK